MSALSTTKVMSGAPKIGGYVFWAPLGTATPTDEATELDAAFVNLGYITSEGVKPDESAESNDERDWNEDIMLSTYGSVTRKYVFTLASVLDPAVQAWRHGAANVTATAATAQDGAKMAIVDRGEKINDGIYVFELSQAGKGKRVVIPQAGSMVTGVREWTKSRAQGFEVTVTAYRDAAGAFKYEYSTDGVPAA